ncbi:MAG: PIN domain-containing protein [Candidatus Bathyarchaeota archaeon]|nr:PIN domain-containing protein [Candidatus Bathyarchaeota archaeon]
MGKTIQPVYVDTNVFVNALFDDIDRKDLVESSRAFLEHIIKCKYYLYISELTIIELKKVTEFNREMILNEILRPYSVLNKITILKKNIKIAEEANYFSSTYGVHPADALHAMSAKMNKCWLITFDRELKRSSTQFGVETFDPRDLIH